MCRRLTLVGFIVLATLVYLSGSASCATIYVSTTGSNGNDGLSWANAKLTIDAAITAAVVGDIVFVRSGTYSTTSTLTMKQGVSVYGGFAGTEARVYQRVLSSETPSVIDGSGNSSSTASVVTVPAGVDEDTAIDGFTITGGKGTVVSTHPCGGGIYVSGSGLTVSNCRLDSNINTGTTIYKGGGICGVSGADVHIHNCVVTGNNANYGAGIYIYKGEVLDSTVTLNGSTTTCSYGGGIYVGNYATTDFYIKDTQISHNSCSTRGGGIYVDANAAPRIIDCDIHENQAFEYGGGICASASSPVLDGCDIRANSLFGSSGSARGGAGMTGVTTSAQVIECTIENNTIANSASTYAAGLYMANGSPIVTRNVIHNNDGGGNGSGLTFNGSATFTASENTIWGNDADGATSKGGGVAFFGTSTGIFERNKVYSNTAVSKGGAVYYNSTGSTTTLRSNLIYLNDATEGSGVYVQQGLCNLYNNTIAENSSDGVYVFNTAGVAVVLSNNIVALNVNGVKRYNTVPSVTLSCNDVYGNTGAHYVNITDPTGSNGNISQSPLFADYANNDYDIQSGSPCQDTGTNSAVAPGAKDVVGNSRILSTTVDMGSYEYGVSTPEFDPPSGNPNGYVPLGVRITCNTPGVSIYFTLDDSDPTQSSRLYDPTGVVVLGQSLTLKARAYKTASFYSDIAADTYGQAPGGGDPPDPPVYKAKVIDYVDAPPTLSLTGMYEPNHFDTQWSGVHDNYSLQRVVGATTSTLVAAQAQTQYTDTYEFTSGSPFTYQVKGWGHSYPDLYLDLLDPSLVSPPPAPEEIYHRIIVNASDWVPIQITPVREVALENQAVDSRYDLRHAEPVFADHQFGNEIYKGGLFAGFADIPDRSRVGRSFLQFGFNPLSANSRISVATVNAYHTGSTPNQNHDVGCQRVDDGWNQSGIVWTNAPSVNPSAASYTRTIAYDALGYFNWPLLSCIAEEITGDSILSVCAAATNESANRWVYFAKKEYDISKAPTVLYATQNPGTAFVTSVTLSTSSVEGGQNVTGTVRISGRAPADFTVRASSSNGALAVVRPVDVQIEEGQLTGTFVVSTAIVTSQQQVQITCNGTPAPTLTITP